MTTTQTPDKNINHKDLMRARAILADMASMHQRGMRGGVTLPDLAHAIISDIDARMTGRGAAQSRAVVALACMVMDEAGMAYTDDDKARAAEAIAPSAEASVLRMGKASAVISTGPRGVESVSVPALAEYVMARHHMVLVDEGKDRVQAYEYREDGVTPGGTYQRVPGGGGAGIRSVVTSCLYDDLHRPDLYKASTIRDAASAVQERLLLTAVTRADFDADPNVVNFQNGLLDWRTLELTPHTAEYLSMRQVPVPWMADDVPTPLWDRYLDTLTRGDAKFQRLIYETMGLAVMNVDASVTKKCLLMRGDGDTGKSIALWVCQQMLGPGGYLPTTLEALESRFETSYAIDKRLLCNPDMGFARARDLSVLKQLSGGDEIRAEQKGGAVTGEHFRGVMWFVCNEWPKFGGDQGPHVYERFICLECTNVIPEAERIRDLRDRLRAEFPGIARRAILAARDMIARGYTYTIPESAAHSVQAYRADNDEIFRWMQGYMMELPANAADLCKTSGIRAGHLDAFTVSDLYTAYTTWYEAETGGVAHMAGMKEFRDGVARYIGRPSNDVWRRTRTGTVLDGWYPRWDAWCADELVHTTTAPAGASVGNLCVEFIQGDDGEYVKAVKSTWCMDRGWQARAFRRAAV